MSEIVTKETVLTALSKVNDPELGKDLVTLGMIHKLEVQDGRVSFDVVLTTPACPLRAQIEADARQAVTSLPGVKSVNIRMGAKTRQGESNRNAENVVFLSFCSP